MINVTINTNTPNPTSLSGFYTAAFICRPPVGEFTPSRTSTVTSLQDCIDAGFDETTEVYEWLKVGLSQSPRMSQFIIRLMLDGESVSDALDSEPLNVLYLCIEDIDLVHKKQLADYVYGSGYLALISCVDDSTLDFSDNPNVIYIHKAMYDENYIQLDSDEFPDESVATDTETTPTAQYPEAAWVSRFGSQQPASIEWLNKPLAAVMPPPTTPPTSSNYYGAAYDALVATGSGKTMSGEWIDQTVFLKWLEISLRSQIFSLLHDKAKVSFTVADKEMLLNKVRYVLSVGERLGGISRKYEAYIVAEQREQRNIIIGFKAQLLNGINSVEDIQGTITA